jgi:SAM-dependent methyltransferase
MNVLCETTACPLCAGDAADPLVDASDPLADCPSRFHIVRCRACGLAYTNPRPRPDAIGQFYPEHYIPHQERFSSRSDPFVTLLGAPPGRLLDFGCGAGALLQRLHHCGWHVTGVDRSPRVVRHVHQRLGLPALLGSLPHPDLPPHSFAAVTMAESLEHVHDPLGALRAARDVLVPGGRLVISVPNLDSLAFRWFGSDWLGLDVPRHLTHFTPQTLRKILERAEFRVLRLRSIRHNSWLRHSAGRARTRWGRLLRHRLPASLAGWYSAAAGRCNGILALATKDS